MSTLNSASRPSLGGLNRFNLILMVVLVVQLVIGAIIFWPQGASEEVLSLTLDNFAATDVVGLTIIDDKADQIAIQKAGDGWELADIVGFPVNGSTVTELLDKVVGLNTNRLVTRTRDSHARLQVGDTDFARQLVIETSAGQSHILYLGSSPNAGSMHIRQAGQDEVYLTSDLAVWQVETRASAWINTDYFQVPSADITAISLSNTNDTVAFEKIGEDQWIMAGLAEGEELLVNNVKSLATRVASLRMTKPIGTVEEDWMGLANPQAAVILSLNSGESHTIIIGGKNEAGEHVMKASNSPYYVWVSQFTVEDLFNRDRASFLAQPGEEGQSSSGE